MTPHSNSKLYVLAAAAALALPLAFAGTPVGAVQKSNGSAGETTCEVVSVGNWYCTIDGKGYYCTTPTNPDKNKDCIAAKTTKGGNKNISRVPGTLKLKSN